MLCIIFWIYITHITNSINLLKSDTKFCSSFLTIFHKMYSKPTFCYLIKLSVYINLIHLIRLYCVWLNNFYGIVLSLKNTIALENGFKKKNDYSLKNIQFDPAYTDNHFIETLKSERKHVYVRGPQDAKIFITYNLRMIGHSLPSS